MSSNNHNNSMFEMDNDTRVLVLVKTWCHGQLVLPFFALAYLWLYLMGGGWIFLVAGMYLPYWSYYSFQRVVVASRRNTVMVLDLGPLWMHGVLVEAAHVGILWQVTHREFLVVLSKGGALLLAIFSGLALVETLAFLCVVTTLERQRRKDMEQYQELEDHQVVQGARTAV